jgi:hypothetical protein
MLKLLNVDTAYVEMQAFAPGVIDQALDHADIEDDIALADIDPWEFPDDEDDPE